MPILMDRADV
jgi:hypothetical protein